MRSRKEAFGASSAGSKSRTGSQAAAKGTAQRSSTVVASIESSHGGASLGKRKATTGRGGAQHK